MGNFKSEKTYWLRVHIFIEGRVQGVGYRWWTRHQAKKLGLVGWVRNLHDKRVEAVFEGPKDKVEVMVNKCKKGPLFSKVYHIDISWEKPENEFSDFEILPTV